mmetsp:Transcript_425/g.1444  ORF Transcript_425/g.1444 Transcript_425/m.1444 type:complete len:222 (-) Transcript_425:165-830(-)
MRSRRCGRSAPSSGLYVAIRSGLHGCRMEMPSRSTVLTPSARTLRRRFEMPSSRRLISSTYNTPRCASASSPGWYTVLPVFIDSSMSTVPTRRSSVTPSGICTKGASRTIALTFPASSREAVSSSPVSHSSGFSGLALLYESATTSIGGSSACKPRAMIVLAVPRFPAIATPPSSMSTPPNSNDCLMLSMPTTDESGNPRRTLLTGAASDSGSDTTATHRR